MKVLLTGAFGNLGIIVLQRLLDQGHTVTCLDVNNPKNARFAATVRGDFAIQWGDIRNQEMVNALVQGQEAIIHLAAIVPPLSEHNATLAEQVNVQGTETLVRAAETSALKPVFVFASSFAVYGEGQDKTTIRTAEDPKIASEIDVHYSLHKIACEELITSSSANWVILRIGAMIDSRLRHSSRKQQKMAFDIASDTRVDFIHPINASIAFVNAIKTPEALSKVLLLSGGASCHITYLQLMNATTEAMGITLTDSCFGNVRTYFDWMDGTEAERILAYQKISFADFCQECRDRFKWIRFFVKPFSPLIIKCFPLYIKWLNRK